METFRPGGPARLQAEVMTTEKCTGCGMCAGLCPYIRFARDRVKVVYPCGLEEGNCYRTCPRTPYALEDLDSFVFGDARQDHLLGQHRGIYYARADRAVRPARVQYGGVTTALVGFALEQGIVEAGLLVGKDMERPVPRLARTWTEVADCAGSRYLAVPSLAGLLPARQQGLQEIAVVGRPCQVTAVRRRQVLADRPTGEEKQWQPRVGLVIGLFCFWALEANFTSFLASRTRAQITRMDITPQEVMVETTSGPFTLSLDEVRPFIKPACQACFDPTSELADIAVGSTEDDSGWNTLIIRTSVGEELVREAEAAHVLQLKPYPAGRLPALREAAWRKKHRVLQSLAAANDPYLLLSRDYQLAILGEEAVEHEHYARSS